jgi:hypothetical protein
MSNEKTKNITIQQIDKLATILESNSFRIKKEAGKYQGLAKLFQKSFTQALGGATDDAAKAAATNAAKNAVRAKITNDPALLARIQASTGFTSIDDFIDQAAKKGMKKIKLPGPPTPNSRIPPDLQQYLKYDDAAKKYVTTGVPPAAERRAIQKQISTFIAGQNKLNADAAKAAAKAARDLAKFQAGIDAAVEGMGFTAKARKGAIALGSLSVLYFMLTGKSASSEDPNSQKVIKKVMENAGSMTDNSIKLPNLTNKISSFTSSLNSLNVSEEKKTRLSGYIDKLSSIQKALEKCGEPLSDKNANTFTENLKTAENEINSYLGKHDNLIAFLTKNSDLGPAAEGIKQDLINYLGAVEETRKNMGKA